MKEPKTKQPVYGNGKICYIEIPALDISASANFYEEVFGWNIRQRGNGNIAFDDGVFQVSGTWVLNRPPIEKPGMLVYIMVDSIEESVKSVLANGGTIVQEPGADAPEITARFLDPAGNLFGLYQERNI